MVALVVSVGSAQLAGSAHAAVESVPQALAYQGFLSDSDGAALDGARAMRFSIYAGGLRVWYAEYASVQVSAGFFSVSLGEPAQGGSALDPIGGTPVSVSLLPVGSQLFSGVDSSTDVELEMEIFNGAVFETLAPRVRKSSALFALKADMIDGYDSSQLAKVDVAGAIMASDGTPVIGSDGTWIGASAGLAGVAGATGAQGPAGVAGATGAQGPAGVAGATGAQGPAGVAGATGAQGPAGVAGATGAQGPAGVVTDGSVTAAKLASNAVTAAAQFKVVTVSVNGTSVVVDCGAGFVALSGNGDCSSGGSNRILASCHATTGSATSCSSSTIPQQFWLVRCGSANSANRAFATCVKL